MPTDRPMLSDLDLYGGHIVGKYRYIVHDRVPEHEEQGWQSVGPCPEHHGHYSTMMEAAHYHDQKVDAPMTVDMRSIEQPAHYTRGAVEVIDYIEQVVKDYPPEFGFCIANAIKYLSRAPHKGSMAQDLAKARWYIDRALSRVG